ncbi:hypothetical protein CLAIMM_02254 [Cladophialophora immunda]|nr:hypothetical protein CLAIMM_02254 [Cladophialophora immunda]
MAKKYQLALATLLGFIVLQLCLSQLGQTGSESPWADLSAFRTYSRQIVEQAAVIQDDKGIIEPDGEMTGPDDELDTAFTDTVFTDTAFTDTYDDDDDDSNNNNDSNSNNSNDDNSSNNDDDDDEPQPKIAKITMLYGDAPDEAYERALESHGFMPTCTAIPCTSYARRCWDLAKPPEERLEWLFWFDADTFLLNPKIPLEIYLPPPEVQGVHFLCGNDHNGLNDGAFLLRINDYSVHLLASSLSVETFRPTVDLRYSEQSAIEHVRWLNAYMGARDDHGVALPRKKQPPNGVKPGDLLLHFAGSGATKVQRITSFVEAYERDESEWVKEVDQLPELLAEISSFWENYSKQRSQPKGNVVEGEVYTER